MNKTVLAVVVLFALIRLINIDADFPRIYTDGRFIETDEGWYCNSATSKILTGKWAGEGFQSMPVMPVNHIVQYVSMSIFGVSILTARYTAVFFFLLLLLSLYLINRKLFGPVPAMVSVVPIACSSFLFAYSRIALVDIEMVSIVSLSVLAASYKKSVVSALLLVVAILTKTSAICFVVPVAVMVYQTDKKSFLKSVAIGAILIATYFSMQVLFNWESVSIFLTSNGSGRIGNGFTALLYNAAKFDAATLMVAATVFPFAIKSGHFKTIIIMMLFSLAMIGFNTYQPMRYFIVLYLPISMMIAAGMEQFNGKIAAGVSQFNGKIAASIFVLSGSVLLNIGTISGIILNPSFNMKKSITAIKCDSVKGRMANTVTLWTKIPSLENGRCIVGE